MMIDLERLSKWSVKLTAVLKIGKKNYVASGVDNGFEYELALFEAKCNDNLVGTVIKQYDVVKSKNPLPFAELWDTVDFDEKFMRKYFSKEELENEFDLALKNPYRFFFSKDILFDGYFYNVDGSYKKETFRVKLDDDIDPMLSEVFGYMPDGNEYEPIVVEATTEQFEYIFKNYRDMDDEYLERAVHGLRATHYVLPYHDLCTEIRDDGVTVYGEFGEVIRPGVNRQVHIICCNFRII